MKHKHAELIKAWADGATIERLCNYTWEKDLQPTWWENFEYRIKPEPKPDVQSFLTKTEMGWLETKYGCFIGTVLEGFVITRDGETGKLKSAEVLK